MGGIFGNPFIEGLVLVIVGAVMIGAAKFGPAMPELSDAGKMVLGAGLGYFTHAAVTKPA
jgi:hypothetical protein